MHLSVSGGVLEWAAAASFTRGILDQAPEPVPLPSVADVLAVLRDAGCHGTAWFTLADADAVPRLAPCPDPAACARTGGLDLGEVGLHIGGDADTKSAMPSDAAVEAVYFRKPNGIAVLTAVCRLASAAGPQVVFDDSADQFFAVRPGELVEDLVQEWPW
ncbi:hypothetical protein [Krasilnikovia sp. M28-CT-15]|uniref:hypothetical protein n=1 Tax=Krasilnikovia sp. M28-CT-15 TaxID=3373540 RepID=UPI00399CEF16